MIVKKIKRFTVLAIIIGFIVPLSRLEATDRRTGTISGILSDVYTRQPLAGADVALLGTNRVTVSDLEGRFMFEDVPVGSYSLQFTIPGMQPQVRTDIVVKSNRSITVNAAIQLVRQVDETVTVSAGYFNRTPDQPVNTVNFSNEEIRRAPGSGGDVSRIIASLPSIAQISDQVNNLAVRGGSSHENLFLLDNIPVPNINHFPFQGVAGGAVSLINVDFIEDVEFFAGGFSVIYGDRLSSVMNVQLREGSREKFNGQLSLDFSGAGMSAEGPLPGSKNKEAKGSWMFAARRSYLDLLTNILDAGADVRYGDVQGKVVYDLSSRAKLTAIGLMGLDKSLVTREDAMDLGEIQFGVSQNREYTAGMNLFWMWSDKGYSDTSISTSFTRFDSDFRKTASDSLWLDNLSEEQSWHFRNVNHYQISHAHKLRFGLEGRRMSSRYNYFASSYIDSLGQPVPEVSRSITVNTYGVGAFAEYTLTPVPFLSLNMGLRLDYFDYTGAASLSPRGSLTFKLSNRTNLTAAAGIFRQSLPLLLLFRDERNKALEQPFAYQYSIGFNHLFGQSLRLNIEAYYKDYRNFPVDSDRPSLCLLDDVFGSTLFNGGLLSDDGRARSYGVELVVQKKLKERFYGMISGSWSRTQYRDLEGIWRDRAFDNRFIFSIQGGYKLHRNWEFSLRWIIAGGLPYTPFDIDASRELNSGIYDISRINEERMPAYHSLSLRLDRRFHFSGSNLTAYVSIWNAYNRKNTASYYWNEIENKPDFSYQFSLLPVLGIEFEF